MTTGQSIELSGDLSIRHKPHEADDILIGDTEVDVDWLLREHGHEPTSEVESDDCGYQRSHFGNWKMVLVKLENNPVAERTLVLEENEGVTLLEWIRDQGWKATGVEVLVSTRAYTGQIEPMWCRVEAVSPGSASAYPVKATITDRGPGQWKYSELLAVRISESTAIAGAAHESWPLMHLDAGRWAAA